MSAIALSVKTVTYAHDVENGEFLSPQLVDRFPYCGDAIFADEDEFSDYLKQIAD